MFRCCLRVGLICPSGPDHTTTLHTAGVRRKSLAWLREEEDYRRQCSVILGGGCRAGRLQCSQFNGKNATCSRSADAAGVHRACLLDAPRRQTSSHARILSTGTKNRTPGCAAWMTMRMRACRLPNVRSVPYGFLLLSEDNTCKLVLRSRG